jgi:hypothetical protein
MSSDISGLPLPVPSPCFFNIQGLRGQIANPEYEPVLQAIADFVSTNNILLSLSDFTGTTKVKWMSAGQALNYEQQLSMFRRVYAYNQCAYSTSQGLGVAPVYYKFMTYNEYNTFRSSVETVNKLYTPVLMGILFDIPFPPYGSP